MSRALMLVDVQRNMLEPPVPVPSAVSTREALQGLLLRARQAGALVIHVENDGPPGEPDEPGTDGWQLVFPVSAGELGTPALTPVPQELIATIEARFRTTEVSLPSA